ncbi:uncharacterized protein LOC108046662 [Drosophila rhopaloa]|uniref:Uncharacterized protein LOC108046662 n=1 Tax=Drosophila rhopaloa TaxID=1041015 RepID=A0A6P4EV46_DRORH|nr:uncharacterized protein LOC108046662 [Drosophila rhopaloa]XP_016981992.1 uncharacterized protein LOC108046662 [Drosophila rhopaloa]XP_016981993.1 uncharacterized protein LOC108046662 [Drosophila rhopaloa]
MKMSSGNQEAMSTKAAVTAVDEDKASPVHPASSSAPGSIPASSHVKALAILVAIVLCSGSLGLADGLKCHMCGQYNEGVGSITPCTNYTKDIAHLYLKECTKKSEKFCVKYVSELSTVRDCATECQEKEIWETQTYCCTEDGCNSGTHLAYSVILLTLPIISMAWPSIFDLWNPRR